MVVKDDSFIDEKHNPHLDLIFGWIVGLLFALAGYKFLEASLVVALILWILALLLIPLTRDVIQDNLKFKLSIGHTFALIIIGFVIAGYMYNNQGLENPLIKVIEEAKEILPLSADAEPSPSQDVAGKATATVPSSLPTSPSPTSLPSEQPSTPTTTVTIPSTYKFKLDKSGITLYIEDIVFEQRGASFGDVTKVKYTVVNNVGKAITPALKLLVYEKNQDPSAWANKILETTAPSVASGQSYSELVLTKVTIPQTTNEKIIKFILYDQSTSFTYLTLSDKIQFMASLPVPESK